MTLKRREGATIPRRWDGGPFRVLALDPGVTTGWAFCSYTDPNKSPLFYFDCGHLGPRDHHQELWSFLENTVKHNDPPIELVCESFEFRQHINRDQAKTKVELMSKEYIGVVKLFGQVHNITPVFYTASAAKSLVPDKGPQANVKIKQLGWYKPVAHWVHAMDATRHLLRYLVIDKRIREPITDKWLGD